MSFRSVLLPEPLRPTMPKNSPRSTENVTSRTASNWSKVRRRNGWSARSLMVCICSCGRLNCLLTPSTTIAGAVIQPILAGDRARMRACCSAAGRPVGRQSTRRDSHRSPGMTAPIAPRTGLDFVPRRFHVVHTAPAWMSMSERVLVYALVTGLQPERILEIGTFQGGSTMIMCAALDDLGSSARIVCVDPDPRIEAGDLETFQHRATIVAEPSPDALVRARDIAGGAFDFALIDGDHSYEGVLRDIDATLPALAAEAHIVFHDAHYHLVRAAIDEAVRRLDGRLDDAGLVSAGAN